MSNYLPEFEPEVPKMSLKGFLKGFAILALTFAAIYGIAWLSATMDPTKADDAPLPLTCSTGAPTGIDKANTAAEAMGVQAIVSRKSEDFKKFSDLLNTAPSMSDTAKASLKALDLSKVVAVVSIPTSTVIIVGFIGADGCTIGGIYTYTPAQGPAA